MDRSCLRDFALSLTIRVRSAGYDGRFAVQIGPYVLYRHQHFGQLDAIDFRHLNVRDDQSVASLAALFHQVQPEELNSLLRAYADRRFDLVISVQNGLKHLEIE